MPTGPSGIYTLPPSYLAVGGETIRTEQHNPPLEDIAQGLTDRLPRSGVAPMAGTLQMGGNKISNMAAATAPGDAVRLDQLEARIPAGVIVMWSGAIGNIPAGWALCNGANGTPDLRDRFVVGAGSSYEVGATGGASAVALTGGQMPAHTHGFSGTTSAGGDHWHLINHQRGGSLFGFDGPVQVQQTADDGGGANVQPSKTSPAGNHAHTFSGTTGNAGSGQAHENRPPYYALAYIMKL
jgi:microcystin-dependent protein